MNHLSIGGLGTIVARCGEVLSSAPRGVMITRLIGGTDRAAGLLPRVMMIR